jgi:hypothetical protein
MNTLRAAADESIQLNISEATSRDQSQKYRQHHCPDTGHDDRVKKVTGTPTKKMRHQKSTGNRAYEAGHEIHNRTVAPADHESTRKPAGN